MELWIILWHKLGITTASLDLRWWHGSSESLQRKTYLRINPLDSLLSKQNINSLPIQTTLLKICVSFNNNKKKRVTLQDNADWLLRISEKIEKSDGWIVIKVVLKFSSYNFVHFVKQTTDWEFRQEFVMHQQLPIKTITFSVICFCQTLCSMVTVCVLLFQI